MDFVQRIYEFNRDAHLLDQPIDDYREASFLIEEALEGFNTHELALAVEATSNSPKDIARAIVALCKASADTIMPATLSPVDRLDKACDSNVFSFGYMLKQGLSVDQCHEAMNAVMDANLQKLTMPRDSFGKLEKPASFIGPEVTLQRIIDSIKD